MSLNNNSSNNDEGWRRNKAMWKRKQKGQFRLDIDINDDLKTDPEEEATKLYRPVFQKYRNAKCPNKAHPQSVTNLCKRHGHRVATLLEAYSMEDVESAMDKFCQDEYWREKGLPFNAFFKLTASFMPKPEMQEEEPAKPEPLPSTPPEVVSKVKLKDDIQKCIAISTRMGHQEKSIEFTKAANSIKGKDVSQFTLYCTDQLVSRYLDEYGTI